MKVIGLTGGIGSGKTTLLRWFETQNIPCFESDDVAKTLLNSSLKSFVSKAFGNNIYNSSGILDRKKLAALVFNDPKDLAKLNAIVHPAVEKAFEDFKQKHKKDSIIIKEAAILFESGGYENCDAIILVIASEEIRIQRVVKRDNIKKRMLKLELNFSGQMIKRKCYPII